MQKLTNFRDPSRCHRQKLEIRMIRQSQLVVALQGQHYPDFWLFPLLPHLPILLQITPKSAQYALWAHWFPWWPKYTQKTSGRSFPCLQVRGEKKIIWPYSPIKSRNESHVLRIMWIWDPKMNLLGGWAYPSEKWWSSSVGMMTFPIFWKKKCSKPPTSEWIDVWFTTEPGFVQLRGSLHSGEDRPPAQCFVEIPPSCWLKFGSSGIYRYTAMQTGNRNHQHKGSKGFLAAERGGALLSDLPKMNNM